MLDLQRLKDSLCFVSGNGNDTNDMGISEYEKRHGRSTLTIESKFGRKRQRNKSSDNRQLVARVTLPCLVGRSASFRHVVSKIVLRETTVLIVKLKI